MGVAAVVAVAVAATYFAFFVGPVLESGAPGSPVQSVAGGPGTVGIFYIYENETHRELQFRNIREFVSSKRITVAERYCHVSNITPDCALYKDIVEQGGGFVLTPPYIFVVDFDTGVFVHSALDDFTTAKELDTLYTKLQEVISSRAEEIREGVK